VRSWHVIVESPVFAAFVAGLYVSVFYVMTNLTMLSGSSAVVVVFVLITPITIAVALLCLLLHLLGKNAYAKPFSIFVCAVYLLILMQRPVFEIRAIGEFFDLLDGTTRAAAKIIYLIVPAALLGYAFRNNIGKFAVVLGAMTIASFVGNISLVADDLIGKDHVFGSAMAKSLQDITLSRSPNIYFILADGYSSFAYMEENGIDVGGFRSFLSSNGFHLYDEAFSNYHSTSASLPAMLNMDHHYYALTHSHKSGEARKTARVIIGGKNNLADLLRRNSYQVQYIHNWPYLLLHGCTADHCYGEMPLAGARIVLGELLPFEQAQVLLDKVWAKFSIKENKEEEDYWVNWVGSSRPSLLRYGIRHSLEGSRREVVRLIEENVADKPTFQYIHLFAPGHAPDLQVGICDEDYQITYYSERVAEVNRHLQALIGDIVARDSNAVIVVTGDHGPFIANQCSRWTDLGTQSDYRDRMGVIMAVRWPEGYDGRYDKRIKTTINVFRYVLASLTEDDTDILETVVCDDVYILGSTDILKVVADGDVLIPPEHYTSDALQAKRRGPCPTSDY
jgi:hypothetical protein